MIQWKNAFVCLGSVLLSISCAQSRPFRSTTRKGVAGNGGHLVQHSNPVALQQQLQTTGLELANLRQKYRTLRTTGLKEQLQANQQVRQELDRATRECTSAKEELDKLQEKLFAQTKEKYAAVEALQNQIDELSTASVHLKTDLQTEQQKTADLQHQLDTLTTSSEAATHTHRQQLAQVRADNAADTVAACDAVRAQSEADARQAMAAAVEQIESQRQVEREEAAAQLKKEKHRIRKLVKALEKKNQSSGGEGA